MKDENPRILLLGPIPPPPGGIATWTLKYINYYKKHGYEFKHVNTSIIGKRISDLSKSICFVDELKRCVRIWTDTINGIKKYHPNIVHINSSCSARGIYRDLITVLLVSLYKINLIFHCRCDVESAVNRSGFRRILLKFIMNKSSAIFVQNRFSEHYVIYILNQKKDKVYLVPNYIEKEKIIEKKIINQEIKKIIYTGHILRTKGVGEIIECAKKIPDIRFELVGLVTEEYKNYKDIEQKVPNIKFHGNVENEKIQSYLDSADIFLLVSWSEGFSNSLVEAMARGLPCIVSDVGANKEMIESFGGVVCENKNVMQIIKAIEACRDSSLRMQQSNWNINKVKNNYSMDAVIDNIRSIYCKYMD